MSNQQQQQQQQQQPAQVDNQPANGNTNGEVGNTDPNGSIAQTAAAGVNAPEDTAQALNAIIDAKDAIIGAYSARVDQLQQQINDLMRLGVPITDNPQQGQQQQQQQQQPPQTGFQPSALGGFGQNIGAADLGTFADLGKEIGK